MLLSRITDDIGMCSAHFEINILKIFKDNATFISLFKIIPQLCSLTLQV